MADSSKVRLYGSSGAGTWYYFQLSEVSYSIADNSSVIRLTHIVYTDNNWGAYDVPNLTYITPTVDGSSKGRTKITNAPYISKGSSATVLTQDFTVPHNSDGTKTVSVSCYYDDTTGGGGATGTATASLTLTTIPRASTLSVTASQTMGTSYRFTISRASSSFRHKITYAFGNTSGTVLDTTTSDVTTKDWTPPTSLASQSVVTGGNKSATITYTLYTYNGGSLIGSVSATATLSIPSADSLNAVTASQTMGTVYTFTCTRNAENYTHKLNWSFGSASGTDNTAFATSKSFTPSTSLGSQIPSSNSGTIYYSITTYNGSTVVGTSSTKSATLSIPSGAEPTFSFSASVTNGNSLGVAIVGYSTVSWSTTGVSAKYGATVASYSFSFAGVSSTDATKSGVKLISGSAGGTSYTPTMVVTDSRGKKTTHTASAVTVYTYSAPVIVSSYAYRSDDSGTRKDDSEKCAIFINAKTDYSCGGKNTISTRLRARVANGSWGSWYAMTNNQRMIAEGYGLTASYLIELQVVDTLGGTKSVTYTIPTASVAFNIKEGGKGWAFGGYAQKDGELLVNGHSLAVITGDENHNTDVHAEHTAHEKAKINLTATIDGHIGLWDEGNKKFLWDRTPDGKLNTPWSAIGLENRTQLEPMMFLNAYPTETGYEVFRPFSNYGTYSDSKFMNYAKGVFICSGSDAVQFGTDNYGCLSWAFRSSGSWVSSHRFGSFEGISADASIMGDGTTNWRYTGISFTINEGYSFVVMAEASYNYVAPDMIAISTGSSSLNAYETNASSGRFGQGLTFAGKERATRTYYVWVKYSNSIGSSYNMGTVRVRGLKFYAY